MRRAGWRGARTLIVFAALALMIGACSIQAPEVTLTGGGGNGGSLTTGTTGLTSGTTGLTTGTTGVTTGTSTSISSTDTSCVGKATYTGVTANEIKLGSTFAYSGPVSNISGPILKGVQSYFNKVNAAGGVFGRKITLTWYDDGWDAQKGRGYIKKLVEQDKVFLLTVNPSSNGLDAARSYLESVKVPVFGTTGLIESQFKTPMQWPVGTSTRSASRISLLDMKNRLGVDNMAIIWLDLLAGAEAEDSFKKSIPLVYPGRTEENFITASRRVSLSEADYASVWAAVQSDTRSWQSAHGKPATGRPDFVALALDPTNTIRAMEGARRAGFTPVKGWGGGQPLYLNLVASNSYAQQTGLIAGSSYYPPQLASSIPAVADYVKTVQYYNGSSVDVTNPFLEGGYAGAALTVEILKRVGSCLTREKAIEVANSLTGYSPAGLTKPMNFAKNHYGNFSYLFAQLRTDGQWEIKTPDWIVDPAPGK